jgi:hypothetical protein
VVGPASTASFFAIFPRLSEPVTAAQVGLTSLPCAANRVSSDKPDRFPLSKMSSDLDRRSRGLAISCFATYFGSSAFAQLFREVENENQSDN